MPTAPSTTAPQNGTAPHSTETFPIRTNFSGLKAQLHHRIRFDHTAIYQLLLTAGSLGLGLSDRLDLTGFDGNIVLIEAGLSLYFAGGLHARNLSSMFTAGATALISGMTTLAILVTQIGTGETMGLLWAATLTGVFLWVGTALLRRWFGEMLARLIAVATS